MKNMKREMNNHISVICKTTNICNANCTYCFDKITHGIFPPKISQELVLKAFDKFSDGVTDIDGCWHGGEPLLIGYDGLEDTMFKMKKMAFKKKINLTFSIQTNGILVDEKFNKLFDKYNVVTGLSHDGITNYRSRRYEPNPLATDSFHGIITVINKDNIDTIYNQYIDMNRKYKNIIFNFVFSEDTSKDYLGDTTYAINRFKEFCLGYIWDIESLPCGGERTANDLICKALGKQSSVCIFDNCFATNIICLNTDGVIYKCDETSNSELIIGHIDDFDSYDSLFNGEKYLSMASAHDKNASSPQCLNCPYRIVACRGGCYVRALKESNLEHPYSFNCRLLKEIIPPLYDQLYNLPPEKFVLLNPNVRRLLVENTYIPAYMKEMFVKEGIIDVTENDNFKTLS